MTANKIYKGPDFGMAMVMPIFANLLLLTLIPIGITWYVLGLVCINSYLYFVNRTDMFFFILTGEKLIIKNQWRPKYVREIPYKDIKTAAYGILLSNPYIRIDTVEDKSFVFGCRNVKYNDAQELIEQLNMRIKSEEVHASDPK